MKISIKYCVMCDYEPKASSLAAAIKERLGVPVKLIKGSGGVFDVVADGRLVYSKDETGRFPEHDEVLSALE